ncbi:hypothetical protein HZH66_014286 [Vespula vulgaris]|uniref:Uncharacterized protein n=1 Tax=Vespula vulgaris TaxID=7454 RepID=A0A834MQ26_VESVU|nr:hypothetical protein HZH66_014286 [Vespula vulgaris]
MSKEDMFDSDNSDNKYYLITEKMQDDNGTSGSGSEICTTRNRSKRFNISNKYIDSDDELNIDEIIQAPIVNGRMTPLFASSVIDAALYTPWTEIVAKAK